MIFFKQTAEAAIGESGFEPPTSCSQGRRANQAAPLPEKTFYDLIWSMEIIILQFLGENENTQERYYLLLISFSI